MGEVVTELAWPRPDTEVLQPSGIVVTWQEHQHTDPFSAADTDPDWSEMMRRLDVSCEQYIAEMSKGTEEFLAFHGISGKTPS
jgi:hypothetical protein